MHERPKPKSKIVWRLEFGVWRWLPLSQVPEGSPTINLGTALRERQTPNPPDTNRDQTAR